MHEPCRRVDGNVLVEADLLPLGGFEQLVMDRVTFLGDESALRVIPRASGKLDSARQELREMILLTRDLTAAGDIDLDQPVVGACNLMVKGNRAAAQRRDNGKARAPTLTAAQRS